MGAHLLVHCHNVYQCEATMMMVPISLARDVALGECFCIHASPALAFLPTTRAPVSSAALIRRMRWYYLWVQTAVVFPPGTQQRQPIDEFRIGEVKRSVPGVS